MGFEDLGSRGMPARAGDAQDCGFASGPGETDAREAAIIAEAARTMPHMLRSVELEDETLAELGVLSRFDDDLVGQITATSNRIRGLLTQTHPTLERALGPHLLRNYTLYEYPAPGNLPRPLNQNHRGTLPRVHATNNDVDRVDSWSLIIRRIRMTKELKHMAQRIQVKRGDHLDEAGQENARFRVDGADREIELTAERSPIGSRHPARMLLNTDGYRVA